MIPVDLVTKTPCCGRKIRLPFAHHATEVVKRTCPKCHKRHMVIVRPAIGKPSEEMLISIVEWTILGLTPGIEQKAETRVHPRFHQGQELTDAEVLALFGESVYANNGGWSPGGLAYVTRTPERGIWRVGEVRAFRASWNF